MKTLSWFLAAAALLPAVFLSLTIAPHADAAQTDAALAKELLHRAGMTRGLCAVLGSDGKLPLELATAGELLIHVRDPKMRAVNTLRAQADKAGFDIQRLAVERGALNALPYADNTADIVITTRADGEFLKSLSAAEILRALRPEGIAIIGVAGTTGDPDELGTGLLEWARQSEAAHVEEWEDKHGTWVQFTKPPLVGADEWSHWEKSPANNPVSNDQLIKAPYMTQYMATPYYIGMPAITTAAGGRTFLAIGHIAHHQREWEMLNRIIARNGYNGIVLWERDLPEGYLVHRSAFIATKDTFHMMDGDRCLLLDAQTGAEKGDIKIPGVTGQWKWMANVDDVLYVLAGEPAPGEETVRGDRALGGWSWSDLSKGYYSDRIPHGFGDTLAAFDIKTNELLWKRVEKSPIDSRGMAILDEKLFFYCPDHYFRSLNRVSGKELWTNDDTKTLELIEEPGKGLTSTPGWRTQTMIVADTKALVIQGQTRMNVIALSPENGRFLWQRKKVTNNPNAVFLEGNVVIGVGPNGSNVALDPVSGETVEDLNFIKRACTRLTASTDSLFCRGEGMTRFDLASREVTVDGAVRPACNDGVIPANGLLYLGPWACDCNLSLIGNVARCSAGDFPFGPGTGVKQRLEVPQQEYEPKTFEVTANDWATYRGNNQRTGSTNAGVRPGQQQGWIYQPIRPVVPAVATAAGGLIFTAGEDGKVRALDAATGKMRWQFITAGPVKYPPAIAENRAYIGSADGFAYCLEAATGKLLWRFRAAPIERHMMVYGSLSSTWPVNTGVLVQDGVAYFGAGIVDHDGTHLYALDAKTGALVWRNDTSGHLNPELHKGVSIGGNLTVMGDTLLLAGGNVVSPAAFDLSTGECLEAIPERGLPQKNGGKFVGVFNGETVVAGGRILYSSPRNVSTKGSFEVWSSGAPQPGEPETASPHQAKKMQTLNFGGIPPAWNDQTLVVANFKYGRLAAFENAKLNERIEEGFEPDADRRNQFRNNLATFMTTRSEERWQSNLGDAGSFEAVSLALAPNSVLAVAQYQDIRRSKPLWYLVGMTHENGRPQFEIELPGEPLPGGLLVDRDGQVIVTLLDGRIVCYRAPNVARRSAGGS